MERKKTDLAAGSHTLRGESSRNSTPSSVKRKQTLVSMFKSSEIWQRRKKTYSTSAGLTLVGASIVVVRVADRRNNEGILLGNEKTLDGSAVGNRDIDIVDKLSEDGVDLFEGGVTKVGASSSRRRLNLPRLRARSDNTAAGHTLGLCRGDSTRGALNNNIGRQVINTNHSSQFAVGVGTEVGGVVGSSHVEQLQAWVAHKPNSHKG